MYAQGGMAEKDNVGVTLYIHCRPMVLNIEVIDRAPGKTE